MFVLGLLSFQFSGCAFDRHAIRQEDQEKSMLQTNATLYWQGIRWNIPERAIQFYEDPLERARFESEIKASHKRYTEVTILHVKLNPKEQTINEDWMRSGSVFIRTEGFGNDNILRVDEQEQYWYRNKNGWWVVTE